MDKQPTFEAGEWQELTPTILSPDDLVEDWFVLPAIPSALTEKGHEPSASGEPIAVSKDPSRCSTASTFFSVPSSPIGAALRASVAVLPPLVEDTQSAILAPSALSYETAMSLAPSPIPGSPTDANETQTSCAGTPVLLSFPASPAAEAGPSEVASPFEPIPGVAVVASPAAAAADTVSDAERTPRALSDAADMDMSDFVREGAAASTTGSTRDAAATSSIAGPQPRRSAPPSSSPAPSALRLTPARSPAPSGIDPNRTVLAQLVHAAMDALLGGYSRVTRFFRSIAAAFRRFGRLFTRRSASTGQRAKSPASTGKKTGRGSGRRTCTPEDAIPAL